MKPPIPGRSLVLVRARNHSAIRPTAVVAALIRASILPLLLVAALVFALPAQPVAAGPASISFSANVLTITGSGNPETVHLSVAGTNLSIRSSIGTSADAGAQGLGFQVSTAANVANTGNIAAANDVRRIDINGAAGTQSILLDGGTFPALTL